jgi:hypothetical protein
MRMRRSERSITAATTWSMANDYSRSNKVMKQ